MPQPGRRRVKRKQLAEPSVESQATQPLVTETSVSSFETAEVAKLVNKSRSSHTRRFKEEEFD